MLLLFKNADWSTSPSHAHRTSNQLSFQQEEATKDHQTFMECFHHEIPKTDRPEEKKKPQRKQEFRVIARNILKTKKL